MPAASLKTGLGSRDTTLGHRIEIASDALPPTRSATATPADPS
jgi:hypothetical protein